MGGGASAKYLLYTDGSVATSRPPGRPTEAKQENPVGKVAGLLMSLAICLKDPRLESSQNRPTNHDILYTVQLSGYSSHYTL